MDRRDIVTALIRLDRPLPELEAAADAFDPEPHPVATLTRSDVAAVVRRHLEGRLDAPTVERWATLVECREDIEFEQGHEPALADALYDLANPDVQGPLAEIAADLLAMLEP